MKAAFLTDRGVVKVSGEDARSFLDGLVTTNVTLVQPEHARFGALLTPQGKIIADFLITEASSGQGGGFLFDCPKALAQQLADRLRFYKLRAKVSVENLSDTLGVLAAWDGEPSLKPDLTFSDPRHEKLGWRILVSEDLAGKAASAIGATLCDGSTYEAHRIACGVPRGGIDYIYGDAFPHETNMDRLHGVDFDKGCYVGQEVVSRMEHRATARSRILPVTFDDAAPSRDAAIKSADRVVGSVLSSAGNAALALIRLDRLAEAEQPLLTDGVRVHVHKPAWVNYDVPSKDYA